MAISLKKGGNVNLSKEAPSMKLMDLGLGWDARATDGTAYDLDAVAFLVNAAEKVPNDQNFVFYGNLKSPCTSVTHEGDNRTGAGDGDDETLSVNLASIPADIEKIVLAVTINEGVELNQNFGQVSNAYIRIVNKENNQEVARFDLSEDGSTETAMIFGELYRHSGDWKFRAVGQGFNGGLGPLATHFGVSVKA